MADSRRLLTTQSGHLFYATFKPFANVEAISCAAISAIANSGADSSNSLAP